MVHSLSPFLFAVHLKECICTTQYFTDEDTEAQKGSYLAQRHSVSGRAEIATQAVWLQCRHPACSTFTMTS